MLRVLATLANPHRLRIVAALFRQRTYVSQLARDLGISRALLQVHLRKLENAGLVTAQLKVSEDGKAMKFYEVAPFQIELTPATVAAAVGDLSAEALGAEAEGATDPATTDVGTDDLSTDLRQVDPERGTPS